MRIQAFLQIAFAILLLFSPAVFLASILRLPSVHRLSQKNRSWRSVIVFGNGLLCFGVTYIMLVWLTSMIIYNVAEYYFETTFGLVPGITQTIAEQFKWSSINELWLREIIPVVSGQMCVSGNATTCQLADMAARLGSIESISYVLVGLALIAAAVNLRLGWKFTYLDDEPKAD